MKRAFHGLSLTPTKGRENFRRIAGPPNEGLVIVNGILCRALIDTGSQVTTVALNFYHRHLSETQIHCIDELLQVKGAGGDNIPVLGCVEVEVAISIDNQNPTSILALVVPDTEFNKVPVLVGTNLLTRCHAQLREQLGRGYLRSASSSSWVAALRGLELSAGHQPQSERVVECVNESAMTIQAKHTVVVVGRISLEGG